MKKGTNQTSNWNLGGFQISRDEILESNFYLYKIQNMNEIFLILFLKLLLFQECEIIARMTFNL